MPGRLPASVVIPTIGRPEQLERALRSLAACRAPADEIVVVDQSAGRETAAVVERYAESGARWVGSERKSIGLALNVGLEAATHDLVLVTHDDCTVAEDWIEVAVADMAAVPDGIVTGSVLPTGDDPERVPSTIVDSDPHDYTGTIQDGALFCNNMAFSRALVLGLGGFDERINPAAEDNDLCYRWLRKGRPFRYRPAMRVWHHDWRTPEQMRKLHRGYGIGQGLFYAKHLVARDPRMLQYIARDVRWNLPIVLGALRRRQRPPESVQGYLAGLPRGLAKGLRLFARDTRLRRRQDA